MVGMSSDVDFEIGSTWFEGCGVWDLEGDLEVLGGMTGQRNTTVAKGCGRGWPRCPTCYFWENGGLEPESGFRRSQLPKCFYFSKAVPDLDRRASRLE